MTEQPGKHKVTDEDTDGQVSEVGRLDSDETDVGDSVPTGGSDPGGAPAENRRDNDQTK